MAENQIAHYCQKCLAANPLGQDLCSRCGTRLMIVVEPAAMRFDSSETALASDEHILERVSVLENRLARLADRMERALDLLLRQAQNSYLDRSLLRSLIGLLDEDGVVENQKLERVWQQRCEHDAAVQEQSSRRDQLRTKILGNYRGSDRTIFEHLVKDGFALVEAQNASGLQLLRRAVEKDPHNGPLLSFVGEQCFRLNKTKLARHYLSKAFEISPNDNHILLLLGLACGDEGEAEQAKEFLETITRRGGSSFAAHYGLGRLFAAQQEFPRALREFKRALASKPSPEAHYALGCLYYQLGKDNLAIRSLIKAVDFDAGYTEALHLLGLVYQRSGNSDLARSAFEKAEIARSISGGRNRRKNSSRSDRLRPSLFDVGTSKRKRLLTGGDLRLAKALREDALRAFITTKH
ncbi:MAG TPA: tetratricopeptide repeat protein [Pyrinomonadaceae bacterium]|nr:tetratricopeptide repeat protein [Pyrinomonadaceae bacterium]